MNRRKFLSGTATSAATAICIGTMAAAQGNRRTVQLDDTRLSQSFEFQNTPVWCWAACIQLVLRYNGFDVSQSRIVQDTFGAVIPTTGNWIQITENLNFVGRDSTGRNLIVSASVFWGSPSAEVIVNHLSEDKPIILAFNNSNTFTGHAVVITGVDYVIEGNRIRITDIYLRDPFPYSPSHLSGQGRVRTANTINPTHMWFVNASPLPLA